jgi:hypothetical protein
MGTTGIDADDVVRKVATQNFLRVWRATAAVA